MSARQSQEENWEMIKSSPQDQVSSVSATKVEDIKIEEPWESLQAEEATGIDLNITGVPQLTYEEEKEVTAREGWQLVNKVTDKEPRISTTKQEVVADTGFNRIAQDVTDSIFSVKSQAAGALNFLRSLPRNVVKLVKRAKASELGVVVFGFAAGGLFLSLVALSNRTYFWKQKAQRVYEDMVKLVRKSDGALSISQAQALGHTQAADYV
eukprot:TRINITY_DN10318_c0_g2_i1.p2 TRINITY_DN10318_c0_g2~~TRINITY_DN10318_c0_g2_i1.p2  ORF type:complete len:210 (-),score=18.87 TRINITY_DN10318_c0_g2_i1:446-1075(-)